MTRWDTAHSSPQGLTSEVSRPSWAREAARNEIDEVVDRFGAVVEARGRKEDHRARLAELQQVLEVDRRERRLARDEDELPAPP